MFYGAYKELLLGSVVALILDSPFTSMHGLAAEYTTSRVAIPGVLISPAVQYLRHNVLGRYGFDILHISPVAASARINIPTIVLSASEDKIVPPALSEEVYRALGGPKMRIHFRGGHNTHRPAAIYEALRVVLVGMWSCTALCPPCFSVCLSDIYVDYLVCLYMSVCVYGCDMCCPCRCASRVIII